MDRFSQHVSQLKSYATKPEIATTALMLGMLPGIALFNLTGAHVMTSMFGGMGVSMLLFAQLLAGVAAGRLLFCTSALCPVEQLQPWLQGGSALSGSSLDGELARAQRTERCLEPTRGSAKPNRPSRVGALALPRHASDSR